jgi:hypothetical protein
MRIRTGTRIRGIYVKIWIAIIERDPN